MGEIASIQPREALPESASDPRVRQTLTLIKTLIASLPPADKDRFLQELTATIRPLTAPWAGEVLGAIVRLLPQQSNWTVAELKKKVDEEGVTASPKDVYNAMTYLARKGRIRRVGYGRYLVDGMMMATSDDFGGETAPHEDAYRTDRGTE